MHSCCTPHELAREQALNPESAARRVHSCSSCAQASEVVAQWLRLADHPDPLVAAEIDQLREAPALLRRLPPLQRFARIQADDLTAWGLVRLLLLELEQLPEDLTPDQATRAMTRGELPLPRLELAILANDIAARLDREFYGEELCQRLCRQTRSLLQQCLEEAAPVLGQLLGSILSTNLVWRQARRQLGQSPQEPGTS